MEIPVKAKVSCAEGPWGCSTYVIIDPVAQRVTHLVVQAKGAPYIERLVPIEMVVEATPGSIRLCCTRYELTRMELFIEAKCIEVNPYDYRLLPGQHLGVDGHITHLVLRKGPPWRQKNVTVPVAQIESIGENTVHLKLDRISVDALPAIPVRGQ